MVNAFRSLQIQRELADYDHTADFTRATTLALVDRAAAAIDAIATLSPTGDFADFCGLATLKSVRDRA